MHPLIGITAGEIRNKAQPWGPVTFGQSHTYVDAVVRAGGVPVILPLVEDPSIFDTLYDKLDGILFAGGNDVAPELYGQAPYKTTTDVSEFRDRTEIKLMQKALADDKPMLCICRGMQLLNVMLGGTLYQDIAADLPEALDHDSSTKKQTLLDVSHTLRIQSDSRLAKILGTEAIGTNAHHHQAIHLLGMDVQPVAWTEDGIVEAIEVPQASYAIAVQSHPESLESVAEPRWAKLFGSFVVASKKKEESLSR